MITRPSNEHSRVSGMPAPALRCLGCGQSASESWQFSCVYCAGQLVIDTDSPAPLDAGLAAGNTPLLASRRDAAGIVWFKDEGRNPSGSYKDRTMGAAVAAAQAQGANGVVVYSCGNGGAAAAAAAARLGIRCVVLTLPGINGPAISQMQAFGAHIVPLDVDHATLWTSGAVGALQDALWRKGGWFPLNRIVLPLRASPYYLAGCATLASEIMHQLGRLPRTVVVPVGAGDLLLGLWLAFSTLTERPGPRLVAVQAGGADPLVRAWRQGVARIEALKHAHTIAGGIEMVTGSDEALVAVRASEGTAVSVTDDDILSTMAELARVEGIFAAPEGAAAAAAGRRLVTADADAGPLVVVLTATGLKYPKLWSASTPMEPTALDITAVLNRIGVA